jgi:hypothetical protein
METTVPFQYSPRGQCIKRILHSKLGARIGSLLGIRGFNSVMAVITRTDGSIDRLGISYNARVNKGADLIASLVTGAAQNSISSPLPPKYIALSTSSLTPAKTDTTLSGETSSSGMARALGTQGSYTGPSSLDGAASYTVTKTFTASGSITIESSALFDASSSGNLFAETNLPSSAVLLSGDTLSITWTINL